MMVRIRRMMIRVHEDQTEAIAARTAANLERAPPRRACDTATLIPMIPQSRPARLRQVEVGGVRDPQRVEEKRTKKGNRSSRRQSVEESMRHARSILENSQDANGKLQQTEMTELLAQLKLQKEEMEAKLKTVEEEKSKLKLEMESNQREADKKVANAELDVVKKEKEEMAQLIKKLETAKIEMEERLQAARNETEILKEEHQDTLNRVEKVESEKEQLRAKLATVEMSRDDIHMRLMEAEGRSQQLKEAKRAKTLEIRELREKPGVSTPMVEESERQRRTISKNLKRVEEEKAQFRAMMAKMDMIEESTSSAVSSLSPLNSIPVVANQGARQSLAECVSNGSTRLMDFENDEAMQSHPPNRKFIRSSSTSRLLDNKNNSNDTRKMMHNLEQDIMSSQIHNCQMYTQDEVSVISCPLNYIQATVDRPAGWLGDQISNRSYTNLTALEQTPEKKQHGRPPSRSSRSHRGTRSRSRSRSGRSHRRTGSRSRSKSRSRDGASSSKLDRKRERARKCEKKLREELRHSRSASGRSLDS
mmetsp:Transcript_24176/g.44958  ORF Transcript_24176/g.44958 Transcript_24176/m.44958 type:complete len:534 (+) Transcript_24176:851-2452(+)